MQKNFQDILTSFTTEIESFPNTLQDQDIENMNELLNRLQGFLKEVSGSIPLDFDPKQFTMMVDKLQSLITRVSAYEEKTIAESQGKQKQAGAAKAYEKGTRKK